MYQSGLLILLLASLLLAGCDPSAVAEQDGSPTEETGAAELTNGNLGPVTYRYDPRVLTRVDTEIGFPPDSPDTVNAVKFVPSNYVQRIGSPTCSFEDTADETGCTAEREVGMAMALLERPFATYQERLRDDWETRPAKLNGMEGLAITTREGEVRVRYTLVPINGRSLLLVEREDAAATHAGDALQAVRDSIAY